MAHKVPLIVGTNARRAGCSPGSSSCCRPASTPSSAFLAHTPIEVREQILAAYPQYPDPKACIEFGGDMIFGTAVWQIAEAHTKVAPDLRTATTSPRAPCTGGPGRHPRHRVAGRLRRLPVAGRCGADGRGGPARSGRGQPPGAVPVAGVQSHLGARRLAVLQTARNVRCWSSTATPTSSTTRISTAARPGRVSVWPARPATNVCG